jgi:hypothetical protein
MDGMELDYMEKIFASMGKKNNIPYEYFREEKR